MTFRLRSRTVFTLSALAAVALASGDTLRIATWNVSNYTGSNTVDVSNAVYGSFQGRSMSPDVILAQEIQSSSAVTAFLRALNTAAGSPGDWSASYAPLTGTTNTNDQVAFYRTSKISISSSPTLVLAAQGTSGAPRDVYRWDFSLATATGAQSLSMYDVHLKAGSGSDDNARRKNATDAIRADAAALPTGANFLIGGDFNVQSSSQSAYQSLVSAGKGQFNDPINSPGSWNNNETFKYIHTQDPSGNGGMDDRHDQILISGSLKDGVGLDYVGSATAAFSTTTWNDPNHSYRTWGNDGTTYGTSIATATNSMVGPSIANSLKNLATNGGHLPVFLDLSYAAPVPEPTTLAALGLGALAVLRRRRKA